MEDDIQVAHRTSNLDQDILVQKNENTLQLSNSKKSGISDNHSNKSNGNDIDFFTEIDLKPQKTQLYSQGIFKPTATKREHLHDEKEKKQEEKRSCCSIM